MALLYYILKIKVKITLLFLVLVFHFFIKLYAIIPTFLSSLISLKLDRN